MSEHKFQITVIPEKGLSFDLVCVNPDKCMDDQLPRHCVVQDVWADGGTDIITSDDHTVILDIFVDTEWQGSGEDQELWLIPQEGE